MFAAHIMLLVLSGTALWSAAKAQEWHEDNYDGEGREHLEKDGHRGHEQYKDKNHSGNDTGKYGNWTCVCDSNMTNVTNKTLWKDREHWGNDTGKYGNRTCVCDSNMTNVTNKTLWKDKNHSGKDTGKYSNWKCVCDSNMTNVTNKTLWKDKNHSGNDTGKYGSWKCVCDSNMTNVTNKTLWKDREHPGNATHDKREGNKHWGKDDERWEEKKINTTNATNRSTHKRRTQGPGPGHGKDSKHWGENEKEEHEGSHHEDKVDLMVVLFAGGVLAGGMIMAVICFVCQRKRVWVAAPAVGTCVPARPATEPRDVQVIADLERGVGN